MIHTIEFVYDHGNAKTEIHWNWDKPDFEFSYGTSRKPPQKPPRDPSIKPQSILLLFFCQLCWYRRPDGEIKLLERGNRINALVPFIKWVIREDPDCQDMIGTAWVEQLIRAAKTAGAVIPEQDARKRATVTLEHTAKKPTLIAPSRGPSCTGTQTASQPIILSSESESDSEESSEPKKPHTCMHRKLSLSILNKSF